MTLPDIKASEDIPFLLAEVERLEAENARLEKIVYVPGLWRCAKCEFQLVQATLYAKSGTVGPNDVPGEKCPNCNSPLWRVTEREAGNRVCDDAERLQLEANAMRDELTRVRAPQDEKDAAKLAELRADYKADIRLEETAGRFTAQWREAALAGYEAVQWLLAYVDRLSRRSPDGWQTIESAPKDGRVIVVGRDMGAFGFVRAFAHWEDCRGISGWIARGAASDPPGVLGLAAPTHWLNIDPPTDSAPTVAGDDVASASR